jgi:CO dehydrogenase/acetyl-CoA synthase alpha subunit
LSRTSSVSVEGVQIGPTSIRNAWLASGLNHWGVPAVLQVTGCAIRRWLEPEVEDIHPADSASTGHLRVLGSRITYE